MKRLLWFEITLVLLIVVGNDLSMHNTAFEEEHTHSGAVLDGACAGDVELCAKRVRFYDVFHT